jgi:AcrR family transcriptional regulator
MPPRHPREPSPFPAEPPEARAPRLPVGTLPAPPPASIDPYLDAASRCFARYGVARTSVQDVAKEVGVNRVTVYRQVGSIDQQVALLFARDLHRWLEVVAREMADPPDAQAIVRIVAATVREARDHDVLAKVLADEPELLGPVLVGGLSDFFGRVVTVAIPLLTLGMEAGRLARRDPAIVAEWLVRIGISVWVDPPPGELDAFLAEVIVPALEPTALGPTTARPTRRAETKGTIR